MHHPIWLSVLAVVVGIYLLLTIIWEAFETIVLPRTVTRGLRTTRLFYRTTWTIASWTARRVCADGKRELYLSYFGPLSLPLLLGVWAGCLIVGFALLQWAQGPGAVSGPRQDHDIGSALYASGVTFFTLGYGDITPRTGVARFVCIAEAGLGFAFLAVVIGYLPVLYQAFSRREAAISRLDGRASSPATAGELLRRHGNAGALEEIAAWLRDWEVWASELLESHLSYPVLTYYRSQHDHQSWLAALTVILDTCSLLIVGVQGAPPWQRAAQWQARMTFAMARHALIDMAYVFNAAPVAPDPDRMPPGTLARLRETLTGAGVPLCDGAEDDKKLAEMRDLYEPYVNALSAFLMYPLPPWLPDGPVQDNWETSAWQDGIKSAADVHFH